MSEKEYIQFLEDMLLHVNDSISAHEWIGAVKYAAHTGLISRYSYNALMRNQPSTDEKYWRNQSRSLSLFF